MFKNTVRKALVPMTMLFLCLILLWLRMPSQRLSALERYNSTSFIHTHRIAPVIGVCGTGLNLRSTDVVGEALKIVDQEPSLEIQKRVARLILRIAPQDFRITQLPRKAFDAQATQTVRQLIAAPNPDPNYMLLAGIVDDKTSIPQLQALANQSISRNTKNSEPTDWLSCSWTASLALARMGDPRAIRSCVARIQQELGRTRQFDLDFPYDGFDYLDYIRRPESAMALKRYLLTDIPVVDRNNKPLSSNERHKIGRRRSRAFRLLGLSLIGWPIAMDKPYSEDTTKVLDWMQTQKHLVMKR